MAEHVEIIIEGRDNLTPATNSMSLSLDKLAHAASGAAGSATGLTTAEASAGAAAATAAPAVGGMATSVGGLRTAVGSLLTTMAPLMAGLSAIAALKMGLGFQASIETATVQFEVLLGSTEAAQERVKELSDFAAKTPFQFPEVLKASKLLQTFGGSALATGENLTMVGDMAAASGGQFDEVAMWVGRAYDAIQSGRPWGEAAMRLQELGLMSGATRVKLEGMGESGAKSDAIWSAFTDSMGKYGGMMEKQSVTFSGLLSTVMDTLNQTLGTLTGPLFSALKGAMPGVIAALSGVGPALDSLGTAVDNVGATWETNFGGIRDLVAGVVAFIMPYVEQVRTTFANTWAEISDLAGPAFRSITGIINRFLAFIRDNFGPQLRAMGDMVKLVFDTIANVINIAFVTIRTIITVALALLACDWSKAWELLKGGLKDIWGSIENIVRDYVGIITGVVQGLLDFIAGIWNRIQDFLNMIAGAAGQARATEGSLSFEPMQHGGIVVRPTLALLGERGPEAVVPLTGRSAGGLGMTVNVYVAGSVVAERDLAMAVRDALLRTEARQGQPLWKY